MNVKTRAAFSSAVVVIALGAGGLAGCSSEPTGTAAASPTETPSASTLPSDDDVLVVQPGAPGEPSTTGDAITPPAPASWNAEDATFVQMMVPHHSQALMMSALARSHAQDPQVRALAERIGAAQQPEIELMTAWMEEQGVEPMDGMDDMSAMGGMQGMLSPDELDELAAARGPEFDLLFLESMIRHHEGAVAMADQVAVGGAALQVNELAADVATGQSAEIGRMQDLLRSL